ncbi:MAG: hypothetical protein A2Y33_06685 [Spirochaetes bacterium GWF1_51_8]|nr:MAG: hypothetical protein A2Y33_06685 [Spirochaetes bacterium GWF1_51_8]
MMNMDFFPSGFRIDAGGKTIYIDPLVTSESNTADYIFITHEHGDHLSVKDIKKLMKDNTLIVCTKGSAGALADLPVKLVKPGDILDLGGFSCEVVPSYTTRPVLLWLISHPKDNQNAGYVFTFGDVRIYHMGDTELVPEMSAISNITLALVTTSFTMENAEAAKAVNMMKPKIAVPMHYVMGKTNAQKFAELIGEGIEVKIMTKEY